jgi:catechol 2,3-dioxygenase-like lactoylglutathione lyase family enzyme
LLNAPKPDIIQPSLIHGAKRMLDHITLAVTDFERSRVFYDHVLAPLGINRLYADSYRAAGYGKMGKAFFWIAQQDRPASQTHVAFVAPDREAISAFHEAALACGGRDNGAPGPRPQYHDRYFAAFAFDPDGNNIEAVIQ